MNTEEENIIELETWGKEFQEEIVARIESVLSYKSNVSKQAKLKVIDNILFDSYKKLTMKIKGE